MPIRLVGGPEDAAAQLVAHLQAQGVLDANGNLCDAPERREEELWCTKHGCGPLDVWYDCDACVQEERGGPMPQDGRYVVVPLSSINGQSEAATDLR